MATAVHPFPQAEGRRRFGLRCGLCVASGRNVRSGLGGCRAVARAAFSATLPTIHAGDTRRGDVGQAFEEEPEEGRQRRCRDTQARPTGHGSSWRDDGRWNRHLGTVEQRLAEMGSRFDARSQLRPPFSLRQVDKMTQNHDSSPPPPFAHPSHGLNCTQTT